MIKIKKTLENNDGREDIILKENDINMITITEECYKFHKFSYEEMKTDKGLASFLIGFGLSIASGIKNNSWEEE